jgi:quercetin dioxygenase-like cupin family protein
LAHKQYGGGCKSELDKPDHTHNALTVSAGIQDPTWQRQHGCGSLSGMAKQTSRRNFLRTAPVAAAAGFTLADSLVALSQAAQSVQSTVQQGVDVNAAAQSFRLWTAKDLDDDLKALDAKPGDNRLYDSKAIPPQIILTVEKHKSAAEFEWHEGRDHIVQVLDGTTLYEVGGTPKGAHVMGPGEWHATGADGSRSVIMVKGDMLLIPRGTLHKRTTEDSVTLLVFSNPAPAKA